VCSGEPLAAIIARHKDYLRWMSGQVGVLFDIGHCALLLVARLHKSLLSVLTKATAALGSTRTLHSGVQRVVVGAPSC
jgi:hypothetical protein